MSPDDVLMVVLLIIWAGILVVLAMDWWRSKR